MRLEGSRRTHGFRVDRNDRKTRIYSILVCLHSQTVASTEYNDMRVIKNGQNHSRWTLTPVGCSADTSCFLLLCASWEVKRAKLIVGNSSIACLTFSNIFSYCFERTEWSSESESQLVRVWSSSLSEPNCRTRAAWSKDALLWHHTTAADDCFLSEHGSASGSSRDFPELRCSQESGMS